MNSFSKNACAWLMVAFALAGCGTKDAGGYGSVSQAIGSPIRDDYAVMMQGLYAKRASKNEVLEALAGRATRVETPKYFRSLSGAYEGTTITIGAEALSEWDDWFAKSSDTYHVTGEGGNDFILFFDASGQLTHYSHY